VAESGLMFGLEEQAAVGPLDTTPDVVPAKDNISLLTDVTTMYLLYYRKWQVLWRWVDCSNRRSPKVSK
jgi:hypothetical protein